MTFHNIEQNTEEWFELRRGKFTASSFANLFSKKTTKKYQNTIYKVVFERITGKSPDHFEGYWMRRGIKLEPEARKRYELETFNKVHNGGFFELNDWIGCSPDGLIGDDGLVEIKCPKYSTMIQYMLNNSLPKQYKWQVQGQMFVSGRQWCDFVAYHPDLQPIIMRVERNDDEIQKLKENLSKAVNKAKETLNKIKEEK